MHELTIPWKFGLNIIKGYNKNGLCGNKFILETDTYFMLFVFFQPLLEALGIRELPIPSNAIKTVTNTLGRSKNPLKRLCYPLLNFYYIGEVREPHDPVSINYKLCDD